MPSTLTLRHSISEATSRSVGTSTLSCTRSAASPSSRPLYSSTRGAEPPTTIGQKWLSCASAAEWNVRAGTPPAPSARSRARSSAAAARRERERHHPGRVVRSRRDAVGDAVRDRAGLAGAGTGEHAHRADQRLGDDALLVVERGEEGVAGRRGHDVVAVRASAIGPPYQRSSSQRAIDVRPGRAISPGAPRRARRA